MADGYNADDARQPTVEILARAAARDVDRHWAKGLAGAVLTCAGGAVLVWLILHEKAALHTERQFLLESGVGVVLMLGGAVYLAPNSAIALLSALRNLLPWSSR